MIRKLITGLCLACVAASYWAGLKSGSSSFTFFATAEGQGNSAGSVEDDLEIQAAVKSNRTRISSSGGAFTLEDFSASRDPNERLEILLALLGTSDAEGLGEIYLELAGASRYERRLVLVAWLEKTPETALEFVKNHDARGLEFAMAVALEREPVVAENWADHAGIMTVSLLEFEHQQPSEEEVDQWVKEAEEDEGTNDSGLAEKRVPMPVPQPEWVQDFPVKESVEDTAKEIVEIATTHSERGRYWLSHSRNQSAKLRAAGDIGWESNDLNMNDFEQWLLGLPPDLAAAALAGRLERLAADNPDNLNLINGELDVFSEFYNLDEALYLIALRLAQDGKGDPLAVGDLIARIDGIEVRTTAEDQAVYAFGQSFSTLAQETIGSNYSDMRSNAMESYLAGGNDSKAAAIAWLRMNEPMSTSRLRTLQEGPASPR